jgi:hypothetical protein
VTERERDNYFDLMEELERTKKERDLYRMMLEASEQEVQSWRNTVDALHRKYKAEVFFEADTEA